MRRLCSESSCSYTPQGGTEVWGDLPYMRPIWAALVLAMVVVKRQKSADGIVVRGYRM
jgi:hypothetical protein